MEFTFNYKQYTPFSIETVKHNKLNNFTWEVSKHGDVMMNLFLFYEGVKPYASVWSDFVNSVKIYIGENLLFDYPIRFLVYHHPYFMSDTYSKSTYQENEYFLNIPIPRIPLCAIAFQDIRVSIEYKQNSGNISCYSEYVYLSDDDREYLKTTPQDILIHQLQQRNISSDKTLQLSHPVKFIYSENVYTNKIILEGQEYDISPYQTFYNVPYINETLKSITYLSSGVNSTDQVSTCISSGVYSYIFLPNLLVVFNSNRRTFTQIQSNFGRLTCSSSDDSFIYACSETIFVKIKIGDTLINQIQFINPVDKPFSIIDGEYVFGETFVYRISTGTRTIYNNTTTYFAHAFRVNKTTIRLISTDGISSADYTGSPITTTIGYVRDSNYKVLLSNTSAYVQVNGQDFFAPLRDIDPFLANDEQITINTSTIGMVYDNSGKIYIIPRNNISSIIVYNAFSSPFSFFWGFCKDTSSLEPSGSLNFSRIRNVSFPNNTSGLIYAVNYNILRVENGISAVLYAT